MAGSEVARLRQQIDEICMAMHNAMYGYALVGKHEIITHRYEMLSETQEQLSAYIGEEQAFLTVLTALEEKGKKDDTGS